MTDSPTTPTSVRLKNLGSGKPLAAMEIHNPDYHIPASEVFRHLQEDQPNPVWLDSGYPATNHSRFDILSTSPGKILQTQGNNPEEIERFFNESKVQLSQLGACFQ